VNTGTECSGFYAPGLTLVESDSTAEVHFLKSFKFSIWTVILLSMLMD